MSRVADWPARLGEVVAGRLAMPFGWGANDCASFLADCAQAVRGRDVLASLRGPRRNEREARRLARAAGGAEALTRAGLTPISPALAQRGDAVLMQQGKRPVLAVCLGEDAVAPGPMGLERMGMHRALKAWRV